MKIDLTHKISARMPYYPGTPKPESSKFCTIEKEGYTELELKITTHTGTHIDAPAHIISGGKTLDMYDIGDFMGTAAILDCHGKWDHHNRLIHHTFVEEFLERNPTVDFMVLRTGWHHKWGCSHYFEGFPVLSEEAARLITQSKVRCVCMDTISADRVEDSELPVHRALLGSGVMIAENLTNLDKISEEHFELYLIPLYIEHADGSPLRAFAKFLKGVIHAD
jgi:kynurenine formamidase